ncbi:N-acetyltransferase [Actinorhabdospora filicis]|uniref:N-acetyltransferase n=1 Tax=Actinorhabdospora filicis TaxID=1785913 RepID=A0A9W6WBX8_9ACTN|nr:N-acetyltransferase [Actinorhabdospora filicis]GLZ79175.1 N-acetyltransferase [Actinorhabdospora filicis]
MIIRREKPEDVGTVHVVHEAAFGRDFESGLLKGLRGDGGWVPELSLVAEVDGRIVGHAVSTRGFVGERRDVVGLGPIGVLPGEQGGRVGTALMHASIAAADALGMAAVVLVGDPGFYGRFGFAPAAGFGVEAPEPNWGAYFQLRTLAAYAPGLAGRFVFAGPPAASAPPIERAGG